MPDRAIRSARRPPNVNVVGNPTSTRLLVVSEIRFFREGLAQNLSEESSFLVVDAVTPEAALLAIERHRPDIALLHLSIPAGPSLARSVCLNDARPACIALAAETEEDSIVAWAEAGVSGYVPADGSLSQLRESIRTVRAGGAACSPQISAVLLRQFAMRSASLVTSEPQPELTIRELEIARLIESGLSNKEIARALSIALPTVKNHVHSILEKLQVDRRSKVLVQRPRFMAN